MPRRDLWRWALLFQACFLSLITHLRGEEPATKEKPNPEFFQLKQRIVLGLRKSKLPDRVAAIKLLEVGQGVEAAKLLVQRGLTSADVEVRQAAYESLLTFVQEPISFHYLLEAVANDLKKGSVTDQTTVVLRVLLSSEQPDLRLEVDSLIENATEKPEPFRPVMIRLIDGLATDADETSFKLLTYLTRKKIFHNDFGVRRATMQAISKFRTKDAVSELVIFLKKATGEVRADILKHLAAISGQKFANSSEWQEWWDAKKETFEFPPPGGPAVKQDVAALFQSSSSYYDLPLTATRVVFVIDTSRSMQGLRFVRAQEELSRSIAALQPNTYFNVLSFDLVVDRWQPKLVEANAKNKQLALRFVERLQLGRLTASYDALKAALTYDTESIYFLTDGEPSGGKVDDTQEIVRLITQENYFRRITINSIGIGVVVSGNEFDTFLRALATVNYGDYRRVDE